MRKGGDQQRIQNRLTLHRGSGEIRVQFYICVMALAAGAKQTGCVIFHAEISVKRIISSELSVLGSSNPYQIQQESAQPRNING